MRLSAVAAALLMATAAEAGEADWMAGYWLSCDGGQTAEAWIGGGDGMLVGVNLNGAPPQQGFEFMRIAEVKGRLAFIGSPNAAPPTVFPLKSLAGMRATFENPDHDFPQRVIYERNGDILTGRVEGLAGGKEQSMEWSFRRTALGENCAQN